MAAKGRLRGKVALVTGAGRGIGRAVAMAYAREGARLGLCARSRGELAQTARLAAASGAAVVARVADVSDGRRVRDWVRTVRRRFGRIDVLVNNAAQLGRRRAVWESDPSEWRRILDVNLTGPFLALREALAAGMFERGGVIINLGSGAARSAPAGLAAYAASKAGLETLTRVWARELRLRGVRVNLVDPGPTRTAMRTSAFPEEEPSSVKSPGAVGEAFVRLALGRASGRIYRLDGEGRLGPSPVRSRRRRLARDHRPHP